MTPILYSYWRSSAAYRVRIALNLQGIAYKTVPVHLLNNGGEQKSPEHLARNPFGRVPVLDIDGGYLIAPMRAGLRLTTGAEFARRDAPLPDGPASALCGASRRWRRSGGFIAALLPRLAVGWSRGKPALPARHASEDRVQPARVPAARLPAWADGIRSSRA